MKVPRHQLLSDLLFVLAAFVPMALADSYALHLAWRSLLVLSAIVALLVCGGFLWQVQRGIYERPARRIKVFVGLLLTADLVLAAFSAFHSATIRFWVRAFSYCVTAGVVIFCFAEGVRQSREKQILRSAKDNGTV
jgi:cytochrome b subunit of formate dehydrogenase